MKWKRVLALAMSAALFVSAPFTHASLVYADEAVEQEGGMEDAKPEGEESSESGSGDVDSDETDLEEKIKEEKIWKPSESASEQQSGVKISDEMMPRENAAVASEPEEEVEKSGKVTLEETESSDAASELIRKNGKQDSVKELLNSENVSETDLVRVIIVLEGDSILETYGEADMNSVTRARSRRIETRQDSVISEIEDTVLEGESLDIRYHYTWLLNGVATEVPYGMIDEIKEVDGVKKVILQPVYKLMENTVTPYTIADGEMIGREDTWADGYTGKGIKISIIDTGIDDDHQNFAPLSESELTEDSATIDTISSVLGDLNAKALRPEITVDDVYRSTKIAYGFNYVDENTQINHAGAGDTAGDHGTHVAGIAAANDLENNEAVGVAPDAQLYVMKVFGAGGGAFTEDILAALEDSLMLGADVVNMSLGSPAGFTSDSEYLDEIYGRVAEANTILAVAAGNSASVGQGNIWGTNTNLTSNPDNSTVSSPATYVNATSVASVDNVKVKGFYLEANSTKMGYTEGANGNNASLVETLGGKEYEYVMVPNLGQDISDFTDAGVEGKVAVVSRGVNAFTQKVLFAEQAGAVACLIYNNTTGTINMDMTDGESVIPCASITMKSGEFLAAALEENPECKIGFPEEQGLVPNETAYRMSDFSSWGISPNLKLEPDITAPGGDIYSTLDGGNYGLMSGTSMATPNVAGISALVMQYAKDKYPEKSASELHTFVNALLVSTAQPLSYDETTMFSPRSQGSGLANAFNAIATKAYLSVDGMDVPKVELLDDPEKTGAYAFDFRVHNFGGTDAYYKLSTNTQTEDVIWEEALEKSFMAMTPIVLDAEAEETSDSLIYTYDYNEDGKTNSHDAFLLFTKVINYKTGGADEFFRYDLNGSEDSNLEDVQAYLDALVGKTSGDVDLNDQVLKVAAGKEASVSVKVQVTDAGKAYMNSNFENGIYVEGFTMLEAKNASGVDLSLPYMGFYGDWTKAPIIDSGFYWQDDEDVEASQYINVIFTNYGSGYWGLGMNPYLDEAFNEDYVSISPNADGYGDYFDDIYVSLLRNARTLEFTYTDAETGTEYFNETFENVGKSFYNSTYGQILPFIYSWYAEPYDFTDQEGNYLPDNTKINFTVRAELDYDIHEQKNDSAVWNVPITIDSVAPVVDDEYEVYVDETDGRRKLKLTFSDNVAVAAINFLNNSETMILAQYPVEDKPAAEESCTMTFDITGFGNKFKLIVGDYAFNERTYVIRTEDNDPELDENLLYGYRVADQNYQDDRLYGWIGINKETAETFVFDSEYFVDYALTAAEYIDGYIVATDANNTLVFIKPGYWDERHQIAKLGVNIMEMAFNPVEKKLYAYNSTERHLCTIDIASGEVANIGDETLSTVRGMICDNNGTLYGIDQYGVLKVIDKENGVWGEEVLDTSEKTGNTPYRAQSMTYDSEEDAIYWAAFYYSFPTGQAGILYRYSLSDKEFKEIGTIAGNAEVVGLLKMDRRGYQLPDVELTGIDLEQKSICMLPGDTRELNLMQTPWYGTEQQFFWSSNNPEVAEVSENGEVTGISVGTAVVTVQNADGSLQASCEVAVVYPQSKLNGFVLMGNTLMDQWVSFSADDVSKVDVHTEPDFIDFFAGEYLDGYIYAYSASTELYRINAETFAAEKISDGNGGYVIMQDMAYDYSSGFMYGIAQDMMEGTTDLVVIDTMTGAFDTVGTIEDRYGNGACALAVSTDGTIYVITHTGILYTYDVETEELKSIGYTGYAGSQFSQSMAYDHNTDELYWAMITGSGETGIMYVDAKTGEVIPLGTVDGGSQITSMYCVPKEIPERPNVAVERMELTLAGDTMRMLAGSKQIAPVRVYPYNATDRTVKWTVADEEIASIENGMITAKKTGTTSVTGTIGENVEPVTFTLEVFESAGNIYGYIVTDLSDGSGQFWARFPDNDLSTGEGLALASEYYLFAGAWYNGKIYGYGMDAMAEDYIYQYMVIDGDSYTTEKVVPGDFPDMLDMAFDYTKGVMYASGGARNADGYSSLYMVDLDTGDTYKVADFEEQIMTLSCDRDGKLYGVNVGGVLYAIDKETGALQAIGETGYIANQYQSMTFDYDTGNLYWAQIYSDPLAGQYIANLLLVDTRNASVVNLGTIGLMGAEVTALYTIPKSDIKVETPEIEKILLGSDSEMLKAGEQVQISAVPYPLSVALSGTKFTYQSSDEAVATVDENGLVTAVSAGTAEITVTAGAATAKCEINVVGSDKKVYVVNTNGWQVAPLLEPQNIVDSVSLPEDKGFAIASATYSKDGYFYAIGEDGCLWKYTEDLKTVEKIGSEQLIKQLGIFSESAWEYEDVYAPQIVDIATEPVNGNVYVLARGVEEDDEGGYIVSYICEVDRSTGAASVTARVPVGVMIPEEFVFTGENEILIYDGYDDYIYSMSLENSDSSLRQVVWAQGVVASGSGNGMAYSTELNMVFMATADYNTGIMALYVLNPAARKLSKYADAAYADTMVDLILIEGSEPAVTVAEEKPVSTETKEGQPETEVKNPETEVKDPETEVKEPEVEVKDPETEVKEPEVEAEDPETEVKEPETEVEDPEMEVTEEMIHG